MDFKEVNIDLNFLFTIKAQKFSENHFILVGINIILDPLSINALLSL